MIQRLNFQELRRIGTVLCVLGFRKRQFEVHSAVLGPQRIVVERFRSEVVEQSAERQSVIPACGKVVQLHVLQREKDRA